MKSTIIDAAIFILAWFWAVVQPIFPIIMWVFMIAFGKHLITSENRTIKGLARLIVISVPIGILTGQIALEHGFGMATSSGIGCAICVMADQVFKFMLNGGGDLFRKFVEQLIDKWTR